MLCSDVYEHVSEKVIVIFLFITKQQISEWNILQLSFSLTTSENIFFAFLILLSDDIVHFIKRI